MTVAGGPTGGVPPAGGDHGFSVKVSVTSLSFVLAVAPSANIFTPSGAVSSASVNRLSAPLKVISVPPAKALKKRIGALERVRVALPTKGVLQRRVIACLAGFI